MNFRGHIALTSAASANWTNMCSVVTNNGNGKPKYSGENIHLLYSESKVAKKNLR